MSFASALDGHSRPPFPNRKPGRPPAGSEPRTIAKAPGVAKYATPAVPLRPVEEPARNWQDPKVSDLARRAAIAGQASGCHRLVDPATCERDDFQDEREFMQAMHAYKVQSGRMFPTWSEVLEVLRNLGYAKLADPTDAPLGCRPLSPDEPAGKEPK